MSYGMEYPFGQARSAVLATPPPSQHTGLCRGRWAVREAALKLCKHCLACCRLV